MKNIKFKEDGNGQFIRFSVDESGKEIPGTRTASFGPNNKPRTMGAGFYAEMLEWEKLEGNEIEPQYTAEELVIKDQEHLVSLQDNLRSERNKRMLEADKWELPTVLERFGITIAQITQYKQDLCEMPQTHTELEQLENPDWPIKLIEQELL